MKYVKIVSVLIGMLAIGLFYGWIDEKADHTFTKKGIHTHTLEIPKGAFADSSYMWSEERDFGSGRLTFRKNGDNRIAVVGLGSEGVISPEHPKYVVEYWVDASFMLGAASGHGMRWNISLTEKEVSYSLVCVQSSMIRIGTGFVALGAIIAAVLGFILWWILFPRRIKMVSPQ